MTQNEEPPIELWVATINDVYAAQGELRRDKDGKEGKERYGGLVKGTTVFREIEERQRERENCLCINTVNGDFLGGSVVAYNSEGRYAIELFNHMNIDYVVFGNHEFDITTPKLTDRIRESHFKWLGTNVRVKEKMEGCRDDSELSLPGSPFPLSYSYDIREWKGIKIGLIGLCTVNTPKMAFPGKEVMFLDEIETAISSSDYLKEHLGVDFVIAITHVCCDKDIKIARAAKNIDLIIGGHDHHPFTTQLGGSLIHKSGQNSDHVGLIKTLFTKDSPPSLSWEMLAVSEEVKEDQKAREILDKYLPSQGGADEILYVFPEAMTSLTSDCRTRQSPNNLALFVSGALRHHFKSQIGLINGGFVRGNKLYPAHYPFSLADLNNEFPFDMLAPVCVKLSGKKIRDAIELTIANAPNSFSALIHPTGIVMEWDPKRNSLDRLTRLDLVKEEGNVPIEDAEIYTVAMTGFMERGGDNITPYSEGEISQETDKKISAVIKDYLLYLAEKSTN